jgi:PPK2 family polyphosphate:nucleotide phosphotransferase
LAKLSKTDPGDTGKFKDKDEASKPTKALQDKLGDLLYLMFAESKRSLLIVLHGIDTAGKDGTVRHLFNGINPQGLRVHSFKRPSDEELRHDFLWRCHNVMPEAGYTAIFNRSYYEEVSTVMVHPEMLMREHLPDSALEDPHLFKRRYRQICDFERFLHENGVTIVKFLLHISKDEQKKRLAERLEDPRKNWKFDVQDLNERKHWDLYMKAFEKMLKHTDSPHARWHVIPADNKWYRNYLVSQILVRELMKAKMHFPKAKRV